MSSLKLHGTIDELDHSEEWRPEDRAQIVDEADRVLSDPTFKSSKRCVALFRYLVDRSLAGDHESVKERTLGLEVFGRAPDYDTATDPVVRMAANEIRKRLAQWYQEPDHHQRVRIRLNAGTYLLKFEFIHSELGPEKSESGTNAEASSAAVLPETERAHPVQTQIIPEFAHPEVLTPSPSATTRWQKWIWISVGIIPAALAIVLALRYFEVFQSRDYLVWKPLLNSAAPLILSIPEESPQAIADESLQWKMSADAIAHRILPAGTGAQNMDTVTPINDAVLVQTITKWLTSHGKDSILRGSSAITMRDLQQAPAVLIGGFNPWSLVLFSNLRYSIRIDPDTHAMWIQDAQNASKRDWMINGNGQPKDIDYAVISRLFDPETRQWMISFGGLRKQGTRAARNLLIDNSYAKLLPAQIKSTGNFQIIIKTSLVNGSAGPPQILAFYAW
jgi:hypothetical protein